MKEAIWSWEYNHGKAYRMPCPRCSSINEQIEVGYLNGTMHVECSDCNFRYQV